jgi:hypothetical protein
MVAAATVLAGRRFQSLTVRWKKEFLYASLLVLSWKRRCWPLVLLSLCLIYKSLLMSIRFAGSCIACIVYCSVFSVLSFANQVMLSCWSHNQVFGRCNCWWQSMWLFLDALQCLDLTLTSWIPYSRCVFDGWSHNWGVACLLDCPRAVFQVPSNKSKSSISFGSYIVNMFVPG